MAGSREQHALARKAAELLERGQLDAALTRYRELEELDPTSPEWPRRQADLHRQQNDTDAELDALVRCAGRHAARNEFLPALATYKMILSIDPGHLLAQQRLSELQPSSQSVSVTYHDEARSAPVPSSLLIRPEEPSAPLHGPSSEAALDELVLTRVVHGARPSPLADDAEEPGIHEIPLERDDDDLEEELDGDLEALADDLEWDDEDGDVGEEGRALLERCPLFSSLDGRALARLVEQVRLVELTAGEELFHQGDPAGALFIVAKGAVVPIAEDEGRTRLAVLEPGEFFGEISLFTDQPRNATVEALVDSQLLSIDRPVMWKLVREYPDVLSLLLRFLRERLIHRLVRTSPLFQIFSQTKRDAIVQRFRFLEVADGHAVIEQHRPAEAVFILLSGRMDVIHAEHEDEPEKVIATLGPGELFGEMGLLWREPSLATVEARGKCWLLALPSQSFQEMLDHHPQLAALASKIAEERRRENKRTLRDALMHRDGKAGLI